MPKARTQGARLRVALTLLSCSATAPALAQEANYPVGATVQQLPRSDDPAELLAQALRALATEPNNIAALTAAGRNALVLGDPNAAVGFFGRASELAPRDGQVKAGLGSALVQLEKPADALRLFDEASALGVPDADIAEDRGLAYDLGGDNRRAQHDYQTVLAAHPADDTARRRLALSQGMSGDRAAALATLDPLIRKRDIAGWRAQTFVLAMTGDAAGASSITHIMMPQQAERMQPFLVRLATLSPADKARAVHFGEMPQSGSYTSTQLATTGAPATYAPIPATAAPARQASAIRRQQVAVATPIPRAVAPQPQPGPGTMAPAPLSRSEPAPERVTVASGAPATEARFIGPPADPVAKSASATLATASAPAGMGEAMRPAPAPLAATAFATNAAVPAATTTIVAAPSAATSTPQAEPAHAPIVSASPAGRVIPPAPATVPSSPAESAPEPALPAAAPTGHYDLPHEAIAAAPNPAAERTPAPVRQPAPVVATVGATPEPASARAHPTRVRPATGGKADTLAARDAGPASDDGIPPPMGKSAAAGRKGVADDDEAAKSAKRGRSAKTTRTAEADVTSEAPASATKSRSTRKGKAAADHADDQDEAPVAKRGRSGRMADRGATASAADDRPIKGKKRSAGRSNEEDGGDRKRGRAEARDAATPKVYVQVAGGANRDDMDKAWEGVKKKAPDLMKGHQPSTTPLHATNRLLVGPFKSDEEAQAFVNKMAGKGLSGFTVKSAKGQKIEKIDAAK